MLHNWCFQFCCFKAWQSSLVLFLTNKYLLFLFAPSYFVEPIYLFLTLLYLAAGFQIWLILWLTYQKCRPPIFFYQLFNFWYSDGLSSSKQYICFENTLLYLSIFHICTMVWGKKRVFKMGANNTNWCVYNIFFELKFVQYISVTAQSI